MKNAAIIVLVAALLIFGCTGQQKALGQAGNNQENTSGSLNTSSALGENCARAADCQSDLVCLNGKCSKKPVPSCAIHTPGFACYAYKLASNTSDGESGLILDLGQAVGHDVMIIGFNCTAASDTYLVYDFSGASWQNVTITTGGHRLLNGTTQSPAPLPCWKADGTRISAQDAGEYYKGMVYIHYLDLETNLDHKVVGIIQGEIE